MHSFWQVSMLANMLVLARPWLIACVEQSWQAPYTSEDNLLGRLSCVVLCCIMRVS